MVYVEIVQNLVKPGLPQIHSQLHILLIAEIFWKKMKRSDLLSVNGNQICL